MQADTSHIRLLQSMPLFGGVDDSIMGYLLSRAREVSRSLSKSPANPS